MILEIVSNFADVLYTFFSDLVELVVYLTVNRCFRTSLMAVNVFYVEIKILPEEEKYFLEKEHKL